MPPSGALGYAEGMRPTLLLALVCALVALLIAVYPANVYQALYHPELVDPPAWMGQPSQAALWVRLPVQFVLVYWAWRYTR